MTTWTSEELQKEVVKWLVDYYDEDEEPSGEEVAELIDEQVKSGRHWVDAIAEWRRDHGSVS